jgi:hypothetical protein
VAPVEAPLSELAEAERAERMAFYALGQARRGDDGPSKYSPVSPKRVRLRYAEWLAAVDKVKELKK